MRRFEASVVAASGRGAEPSQLPPQRAAQVLVKGFSPHYSNWVVEHCGVGSWVSVPWAWMLCQTVLVEGLLPPPG